MFFWAHRYLPVTSPNFSQVGSPAYYTLHLIEQLVQFSIPAFLFVSGYFVAFLTGRDRDTIGWKVIGKRVKFLVIPYLLWSVVSIVIHLFVDKTPHTFVDLALMLLIGSSNPAYYFVPLLIQFYLVSPFLVKLVKKALVPTLVVTGIIQVIMYLSQYPTIIGTHDPFLVTLGSLFPKWLFTSRIFWFTAGITVGFHLPAIKTALQRFRLALLVALVLLFVAGFLEWELLTSLSGQPWIQTRETMIDAFYGAVFILLFLAYSDVPMPNTKLVEDLGSKSFGIYLVHSPVMEIFSRAVYHLAPWLLANQLLFVPLVGLIGLGVPLVLMYIVKRSPARALYSYLFG